MSIRAGAAGARGRPGVPTRPGRSRARSRVGAAVPSSTHPKTASGEVLVTLALPRVWAWTFRAFAAARLQQPGHEDETLGDALIALLISHPDVRAVEVARFAGRSATRTAP